VKLTVRHTFPCTLDQFWEMYWDPEFDASLQAEAGVQRDILQESVQGAVTTRRVRITPAAELPGPVASLVGSKKLVYEQENAWDANARMLRWKVIPTILPGKLDASGTMTARETAAGVEQCVDGTVTVQVPFVGGRIEQGIVDEVSRSYGRAATAMNRWLRQKGFAS
jgi:hypothetical protein